MPGDPRFLGAIRALAEQAASYTKLPAPAGQALAGAVEHAAAAAMQAVGSPEALLDIAFAGNDAAVTVVIGCNRPSAAPQPDSSSSDGMSVRWQSDGSRLTCEIRHAISA
jgi:hypothetical protein